MVIDQVAELIVEAARLPAKVRINWTMLAEWARDGIDGADVLAAVRMIAGRPNYIARQSMEQFNGAVRTRLKAVS
jgi:hypothetical protein